MADDRDAWTKFAQGIAGLVTDHPITVTPLPPLEKGHKYHAQSVVVDGIRFDSMKESARYQELKLLQAAGEITALELQPRFPLQVVKLYQPGPPWVVEHCGFFTADFRYEVVRSGEIVIEDTKSEPTKTAAYRLRKKIVEAVHGITIVEC